MRPGVRATVAGAVDDWESIYVTIVAEQPEHITSLSDDDLHTLLDPMDILEDEPDDVRLANQLDAIRNELIGVPLRVELMIIDPSTLDAEGIWAMSPTCRSKSADCRLPNVTHPIA